MTASSAEIDTSPLEVSEIVDETFARLQPRLDMYARDSRRINDDGSLTLKAHESVMYGPDRENGFLELQVCDKQSASNVLDLIRDSRVFAERFPIYVMADLGAAFREPKDWDSLGSFPTFRTERDQFPEGVPDYRGPMAVEYSKSAQWGPMHKLGAKVVSLYMHKTLPIAETHTMSVETLERFDHSWPRISSEHSASLVINDGETSQSYDFGEKKGSTMIAYTEVEQLAGFIRAAKDLRPVVDSIKEHQAYQRLLSDSMGGAGCL